jgi:hypothetical protein
VSDNLTFGANGAASLGVSMNGNVAVGGGAPTNYGVTTPGEGVLFIHDAPIEPVGIPGGGSGGIMYGSGTDLKYLNSAGRVFTLTSKTSGNVFGPTFCTSTAAVVFDGLSGKLIKDSFVLITPSSTITTLDASNVSMAYSFALDSNTGIYLDTTMRIATGASTNIDISSSLVDFVLGDLNAPDGTAGSPSYTFSSSTSTGLFLNGSELSVSSGGTVGLSVDDVGGASPNVALCSAAPSDYGAGVSGEGVVFLPQATIIPTGTPNSGNGGGILYVDGNNLFFLTSAGVARDLTLCLEESSGTTTVNGVVRFDGVTGRLIQDTSTLTVDSAGQWAGPAGAVGGTTYGFNSDAHTGMYRPAASQVAFATGGTAQISFTPSAASLNLPMCVADGSEASPAYAFSPSPNTGMYRLSSGDGLGFSSGGSTGCTIQANYTSLAGGDPSSVGGGLNVIFIHNATTLPSTNPTGGGLLYVDGIHLYFRDTVGTITTLSDFVVGPGSSTDDAVAIFNGTDGSTIQNSGVILTDAGAVRAGNGSVGSPGFSFGSESDSGMYISGTDVYLSVGGGVGGVGQLRVNGSNLTLATSLRGVNGNLASPGMRFTGDTNTGIYHVGDNTLGFGVGGSLGTFISASGNISLGGSASYGGGENVVFIDEVTVIPSGTLTSGGILYVNSTSLIFHDDGGSATTIGGSFVDGPSLSTDTGLAYWSGTGGDTLASTTNDVLSDNIRLKAKLRYSSDGLSMSESGSNTVLLTFGSGSTLDVGGTSADILGAPLHADATLRVGGTGGVNYSLSGSIFTINHLNAAGTFEWQQNGNQIMETDASRNLTTSNLLTFSNSTETLTIGNLSATEYAFISSTTGVSEDDISFSVDGVQIMKIRANGDYLTDTLSLYENLKTRAGSQVLNESGTIASPSYSFTDDQDSGLMYDETTDAVGIVKDGKLSACVSAAATTCNIGLCGSTFPTSYNGGDGVVFIAQNTTPPTSNGDGAFLYVDSDSNLRMEEDVNDDNSNCVLNAKSKRARITLTLSVGDSTSDDLDGETWTDVDSSGVSGTTTGALSISDTNSTVMVEVRAEWASNSTGYRRVTITTGAGHTVESNSTTTAVNGDVTSQTVRLIRRLESGDANLQFAAQAYQNSGAGLSCDFTMTLIRMN